MVCFGKGFGAPDPAKRVEIKAELFVMHKRILDFFVFPRFDHHPSDLFGEAASPYHP